MTCSNYDWKAYCLNEMDEAERRRHEAHAVGCAACREELDSLKVTVVALKRLTASEPPRRIAFVSDPVVEPGFWARLWRSGPRLGFASAAMLSLAIVAHGFIAQPPAARQEMAGVEQAVSQRVEAELVRRLPAALDQAIAARGPQAGKAELAAVNQRLHEMEKQALGEVRGEMQKQRSQDLAEIRAAFETMERRMTARYLSAVKYGGD